LTPILEDITKSNESRFQLVKVNIDKLPQIANGLKVSSIPAVFLIYGGKAVDSFVGIPDRDRLQDFFNKAVVLEQINNDPNV
jgi:thioredoxin-like negative regulator of GroEL